MLEGSGLRSSQAENHLTRSSGLGKPITMRSRGDADFCDPGIVAPFVDTDLDPKLRGLGAPHAFGRFAALEGWRADGHAKLVFEFPNINRESVWSGGRQG